MTQRTPPPVSFSTALRFWTKLGFISFGGPAGQIGVMHRELVDERRWISDRRFAHALNYCMLLPGPEAQQLATYIGWLMHRTAGGIAAGVLFLLPSVVILIGLSWVYVAFGAEVRFTAPLVAITAAVVGVILNLAVFFAYHVLWPRGFAGPFDWISVAIGIVAAAALIGYKQHVIPVLIACGIAGLIAYTLGNAAPC